jgi:hypothetical protein
MLLKKVDFRVRVSTAPQTRRLNTELLSKMLFYVYSFRFISCWKRRTVHAREQWRSLLRLPTKPDSRVNMIGVAKFKSVNFGKQVL